MKLKEFLEKYSKLVYKHIELDKELAKIELDVGELLDVYPGVGSDEFDMAEATYLTTETIVNALRELYEREGWRYPKWKE